MAIVPADVKAALQRQAPKALKSKFKQVAQKEFKKIKAEMMAEFLGNPVTQEIMEGPNALNISGTLGGVSNLFAFIGFDAGENPIAPILAMLENTTLEYKEEVTAKNIGVSFSVTLPTAEDIFAITPLPWATGRSWAQGIERGLSGLGYLLRKNKGRSGAAIQSRVKVRGGKFHNTPYISAFLKKYRKRFEELK
tara:strand:+ start:4473 stop:5054 length:582 start_codon:yes stop_codon:yes gene_type:complete